MDILLLIFRLLLFAVFVIAAAGKVLDLQGTRKAMEEFGFGKASGPAAVAIPFIEFLVGFGLLFTATSWFAAFGCLLLLAGFSAGIARQIWRGSTADCHCFGKIHSEPPGAKSLLRNAIIAIPAIVLIYSGPQMQGAESGSDAVTKTYAILIAFLAVGLVIVSGYLKIFSEKIKILTRRVEFLESVSGGSGTAVEREDSGNPSDALPIGAEFPDFELSDTRGRIVTFEHLLTDFRPKLFVFISPACEPCKALIPYFGEWRKHLGERIRFVYVSTGNREANLERFAEDIAGEMLLQNDRELSRLVYAKWTPTALLVNAEGKIASHPAVGEMAIRDLVDRLSENNSAGPDFYVSNGSHPVRIKIGQKVPDFRLEAIDGQVIDRNYLLGRKNLVLFLSTTCSHCITVADQLRRIEKNFAENSEIGFLVFIDGEREAAMSLGLKSPVLLEKDYATAITIGMFGAPSAVIVNEDGVVVTETAVGGPAIWSLLGLYNVK